MDEQRVEPRARVEQSPYGQSLGVRVEAMGAEGVRLRIPYKDENSNPGRALHGGVAASAIDIAGAAAAWAGVDDLTRLELGTLDLSVNYLAAAIGEDIIATAEVLRRGKEITYAAIDVRNDAGKRIASGLVTHRMFDPASDPKAVERRRLERPGGEANAAAAEVSQRAQLFVSTPFIARLNLAIAAARDGQARLEMAFTGDKVDAEGALHEGALAAFIDTSGALASWSLVGFDFRNKASTVAMHVNYHAPLREDAVAEARTSSRNNEIFLNHVTVRGRTSGVVAATGSVTYRIVVG